uniref:C2 domain-containing protein n=1 Tax=Peronospora matthiolae TaxID=2874970 RepID=A0AAV1T2C5_9STRA
MYADAVVIESNHEAGAKETTKSELKNACFEVVGNDLVFALPRSSFSRDSIILRSTNARFWSRCVDPSTSDFLQNGTFADETRFPDGPTYVGGSAAKAQLYERTELRNLRRQIKNQRSRFLSNRSQLYLDLRSATQQAQNYLHEDFLALPAAENAVKIIHNKIVQLDQQLELLTQYLSKVDDAIDGAISEGDALNGGDRDSLQFVASMPKSDARARSDSMKQVRLDVASMSQHLLTPLFGSEDAEFHDARVASGSNVVSLDCGDTDMSTSSSGLFEFELIDLSGTTRDSKPPLFHHSLLTGCIDLEPESLYEATLSTYFGISVSMNEFSVETGPEQYAILLGVIYENVEEVSRVVREDTCPSCATCGGLHDSSEYCNAIWLKVLVKIADAALRITGTGCPIADLLWEQLELTFTLRTDDSLEVNATALTFTAVDVRPMHCQEASEVVRPLAGDGPQFEYSQKMTWTDAIYDLKVRNANFLGVYPAYHDIVAFFATPFFTEGEFLDFDVGFMPPPPPDWQKVDFFMSTTGCFFSLLEDFESPDARALVILTDVVIAYSGLQKCEGMTDMTKCHLEFDQHGIYFSQLPDLQIDASFPLSNSFLLVVDHFVEGVTTLSRRNSFVLAPVETRFSVQDANLFIDIVNNYLRCIPPPSRSAPIRHSPNEGESESSGASSAPAVLVAPHYVADKLLGDVGELRLVLVNNSLGIPIADLHMQDIVCEYIQDEDYSTTIGTTLLFNYFNNSIYRWEPLVEPFVVQMRIRRALEENSLIEVFANLPITVNLNMTPAMAPLLSSEALTRADFVTSGSKSTAPFWVENKTGSELTFSFRRGMGSIIQQVVADNRKVSVDCREQGDMLNFDSASADRFLRETDRQALTVNHTLSVWLNGNKWVSVNPVVVDMVGHVAVPLRETPSHDDSDGFEIGEEEEITPPTLVAEISIQADGSKLISLHSQVVLQNRTSVPLMVWAYSPREGGCIQEWVIDREQICHIPLQLVHPQSKISIRPSPYVQYAPLTTSLEELGDEVRTARTVNTKRFVRAGNCTCSFETFSTTDELQNAANSLEVVSSSSLSSAVPLSGYITRDLPTWKCTYEVEAYFLMRATFSRTEEPSPTEEMVGNLSKVEEAGDKVEDDFLRVFGPPARCQRMTPRRDASYELNEARSASQRRGLYEATNSSLYYLSVSPFLTLHNRLATAMAYRLLNDSLQLIAEGVLAVGNVLPLFQIDSSGVLFVSFRLENYSWSAPKLIINPKTSTYSMPYKETTEPVQLVGRTFDRDIAGEQSNVPNLQLQVKLSGRDVIVFCSIWIVNHTDLDLEYCNSTSSSSKRLENVLKYVHQRPASVEKQSENLLTRSVSFREGGARETPLTCLRKVKPSTIPVALNVVIREARELYNAQYFGSQSPYVRVSLFALKDPKDMYLEKPEMVAVCSATTKPSPSGGLTPQWDDRLQNTLLLRFPPELRTLDLARIIIEVRNVHYGLDTCLGVTAVKVDSILKDRKRAAAFNWYKLLKRKSSREQKKSKNNLASMHRGDISISFSVGMSQELPTGLDVMESTEAITDDNGSLSICDKETKAPYLERQGSEDFQLDDVDSSSVLDEQQTPGPLPSVRAIRSLQRLQTPSNHDIRLIGVPASVRGRPIRSFTGELEATRPQESLSYDPISTRAIGAMLLNGASPTKPVHERKSHGLQVYLPHNRFACVVVEVDSTSLMSEVFDSVCIKCGFDGVLNIDDFDFYELVLPRFVSLRSAGRPEGERWYGQPIPMTSRTENRGRRHGFHLCHKITITTIRLYDEASTASSHHVTPRSLATSSKPLNPAQIRPMPWSDVLSYSSGGKHWDVLRIKSRSSPWSDTIRLNRNAMGNSGVAQVISLTNEVRDQDEESDLRNESLEVALWSCFGSGRFSETIIATVVPRYILINKTEETIKFRQCGVPRTMRLAANELVPFHWPSALQEKLLEVTLLHKYSWSGSFRINSLGTTYLKLRDRAHPSRIYILVCQIELVGGSVALVFRGESRRFPPYRIDNMTSFRIQYKQANWGGDRDYDELLPRSSCPYSWDYLRGTEGKSLSSTQEHVFPGNSNSSSRSLRVKFMRVTSSTSNTGEISDKDAVEVREYNLDEMATYKRIQLHRSLPSEIFFKPEQKGYLLKKDSMLKWNRKYFRLYEHMLYYFANETDQELLGVVDLRTGSNVPGVGSVAIFEKAPEAPSKTGFVSLNGLVSSISDSLFGKDSKQLGNDGGDDDDDDSEDRLRELVHFAVSLTASSLLREESEKFVERDDRE